MAEDREISAMDSISKALTGLEDDAIVRVLRWASEKYTKNTLSTETTGKNGALSSRGSHPYEDVASFFSAASPKNGPLKALVVGYWVQKFEDKSDFDSQTINSTLKVLGHPAKNITDAFNALKDRRPALVMQTYKSGNARQARKKYRLTTEGIRTVESLLNNNVQEAAGNPN